MSKKLAAWGIALTCLTGFWLSGARTNQIDDEIARKCESSFLADFGLGIGEAVERSMRPFVATSGSGLKITREDHVYGLCEANLIMFKNKWYLHPETNYRKKKGKVDHADDSGVLSVAHPEFIHGLSSALRETQKELGVINFPNIEFQVHTMDNTNCFRNYSAHNLAPPRAPTGVVHHSYCHPELCNGTLLMPMSYNQHIAAMISSARADDGAPPWSKRKPVAIWRGSTAQGKMDFIKRFKKDYKFKELPRARLLKIAKKSKNIDASGTFMNWKKMLTYKYNLAVMGNTYASSFKHATRAGALVLRQEEVMYEWFEPWFEQWKHYVPVKFDLSNLETQIQWAKANDFQARKIAEEARKRARNLFSPQKMACYVFVAFRTYHDMFSYSIDSLPDGALPLDHVCRKGDYCQALHNEFIGERGRHHNASIARS
eukprot:CAMPEP_0114288160 /NCGR_PEP_ID=MMETSP0059-20121206/6663_1 /TAXON_ID=36894 /ORGANISM="Pyramimonas parkeae, Strain CCMP726" /LENGTH=429 /DNA_ID=CAMNT_0001409289 /DNA_START=91 /DNA_END=1380 /DNA_ORIENTATION=+